MLEGVAYALRDSLSILQELGLSSHHLLLTGGGARSPFLRRLQAEGRIFLSGTRIGGADWLRCAILSFRTHLDHVDAALDALDRLAGALEAE